MVLIKVKYDVEQPPADLPVKCIRRDVESRLDIRVVQVHSRWGRVDAGRVKLY